MPVLGLMESRKQKGLPQDGERDGFLQECTCWETSWKALGTPPNQPSRGSQAQSPRLTYPQPRGQSRLKNVLNLKTEARTLASWLHPLGAKRPEVGWDLSFSPRPGGGRVLQAA